MTLEQIKAISILDVAHSLGLNIKGRAAHCFAHQPDRHPSLVFNIQRNTFKCFVCPMIHGSVIDLIMQVRECDFKEAVAQLCHCKREAVPWESYALPSKPKQQTTRLSPEYKSMILKSLLQVAPLEQEGRHYLIERGIAPEATLALGVGFLRPETFQSLYKVLVSLHGRSALRSSGLSHFFLLAKEGLSFLLFPYHSGKQIQLIKARCLLTKEEADRRKVRRFVATEPAKILYNQNIIKSSYHLYLCEGEIDTLTMIQRGYPAIGIPGVSSFREEWFQLFSGKHLILCLDNDAAWEKASEWFYDRFSHHGITHSRFALPYGMDINQYFSEKEKLIGQIKCGPK